MGGLFGVIPGILTWGDLLSGAIGGCIFGLVIVGWSGVDCLVGGVCCEVDEFEVFLPRE